MFEAVAEEVFRRYGRVWKASTLAVNRVYLKNQILPWFRGRPVAAITRAEVRRWFAGLRKTPAAANRSLPILSVILGQAALYGYREEGENPCRGIRRYPRPRRERFLTLAEAERLGRALRKAPPAPAALIRLLLLTGCRQSEIRTLRWRDYREGRLFLPDSKTGPRTVWLSEPARKTLDNLARTGPWVFPGAAGTGATAPSRDGPMPAGALARHWRRLSEAAGLGGLRLHDLRHSYASFALRHGESVLTIGRLLGHRDPATTLRYTHFADEMARRAAASVGAVLGEA